MIEIMNINKNKLEEPYDFYVDRRTSVGNPYYMDGEKERNKVCDEYEVWFKMKIVEPQFAFYKYISKLINAYKEYGRLRLFCCCAPKRCHSETIKEYIINNI